jgi:hypothetical protein
VIQKQVIVTQEGIEAYKEFLPILISFYIAGIIIDITDVLLAFFNQGFVDATEDYLGKQVRRMRANKQSMRFPIFKLLNATVDSVIPISTTAIGFCR